MLNLILDTVYLKLHVNKSVTCSSGVIIALELWPHTRGYQVIYSLVYLQDPAVTFANLGYYILLEKPMAVGGCIVQYLDSPSLQTIRTLSCILYTSAFRCIAQNSNTCIYVHVY